jgi:hypothetical protein
MRKQWEKPSGEFGVPAPCRGTEERESAEQVIALPLECLFQLQEYRAYFLEALLV